MLLNEAFFAIKDLVGIQFKDIFSESQLEDIIKNKGKSGQILELAIGLKNTNVTLDFEDGELKTNKCNAKGKPLETMFITQISGIIDELLDEKNFEETKLYKKINNLLYVPISKEGNPKEWFIIDAIHIDLKWDKYSFVAKQLERLLFYMLTTKKSHRNRWIYTYI